MFFFSAGYKRKKIGSGDYVFSMGGWYGDQSALTCDIIDRFNIRTKKWEKLDVKMPEKLHDCFALVCGKYVHLTGGYDENGGNPKDGHWVIPLEMLL